MVYRRTSCRKPQKVRRVSSSRRGRAALSKRKVARSNTVSNRRNLVKVQKSLTNLKRSVQSDQARHTRRRRVIGYVEGAKNEARYANFAPFDTAQIELAMANLRYYDPAIPGTLITSNASTGTYDRKVHVESVYTKLVVRNNYQIPAKIRIYLCTPKADTNNNPDVQMTAGIADQTILGAKTSPLYYPTDFHQVTRLWNLKMKKNCTIKPGEEFTITESFPSFMYDPAVVDNHNLSYQSRYRAHMWFIRIEGVMSHSASAEYATGNGGVDMYNDHKVVMTYDAGTSLDDYTDSNESSGTYTGQPLICNAPVADVQSYSAT